MNYRLSLVLSAAILFFSKTKAQETTASLPTTSIQDLNTPKDALNLINEQFLTRQAQINNSNTNITLITQVGENNTSSVTTLANQSEVALGQYGNNNSMELDLRATTIDYTAVQNGNNNQLLEFNTGTTTQLLQRNITQTGNGQRLEIHGNNALQDRMVIRMNNDHQSLIIRNNQ